MKITLATGNIGKLQEFLLLGQKYGPNIEWVKIEKDIEKEIEAPAENGESFAENAKIKALYYSSRLEGLCLADDSGLCVDALGGKPGIFSSRFAGPGASDQENIEKLLNNLHAQETGVPFKAHFYCHLVLAKKGEVILEASGRLNGQIVKSPRGKQGFGYNPIFEILELGKTLAELDAEEKLSMDHRSLAFKNLIQLPEFSQLEA